jgi:hypothetical protein
MLVQPRRRPFKQMPGRVDTRPMVTLELTLAEGEAMKSWHLKPAADGSAAIDDEDAKSVMVKLGAHLDFIEGVSRVLEELEQAGFATENLSDDQVADLGPHITESPIRRHAGNGH